MDRKYMIMFGSVIGIIIFMLLSMFILSSCSSKMSYEKLEEKIVSATADYIRTNGKPAVGTTSFVSSEDLINNGYLKSLDNYKNDNCTALVKVMNNNGVINYLPSLTCNNYKSVKLREKILEDNLTVEKSGLFAIDGEYIYKGKYVNNYVKIGGKLWRILRIDSNGDIKLVSVESDGVSVQWDNKYNEITKSKTGENEYETSYIREVLLSRYSKYRDIHKKHIVPKSICIGSRSYKDIDKTNLLDCSKKLDDQYVGLINPSDYALASTDKDCITLKSGSCLNYNYLVNTLKTTWTLNAISDNTYQAVAYYNGNLKAEDISDTNDFNIVIYISGDEIYGDGNGTKDKPYTYKDVK